MSLQWSEKILYDQKRKMFVSEKKNYINFNEILQLAIPESNGYNTSGYGLFLFFIY